MGFWDTVYYTCDLVKSAGGAAYGYTSAAVTKVARVDGIQKYWPDDEKRVEIAVFTTTLAKNTAKYAAYEGFKHIIPGATVASKLVSDTMRDVKQQNKIDGMKSVQAKGDKLEKDLMRSTSQPESLTRTGTLSSENAGEGGSEKAKDGMKSTSQPESSTQNSKLSSQDLVKDEPEKANIACSRM